MEPIHQGDVLLRKINDPVYVRSIRKNGTKAKRVRGKGLILAYGEATGHHHRVATKGVDIIERNGKRFLSVPRGTVAELVHEEHDTIRVPAGLHEIGGQREHVAPARRAQPARTRAVFD